MPQMEFLIHELAEKSGVSVRTIRFYIQEGLLPAPESKGRYATFNEDYLLRLDLIRRLKDAFLPLKEIKEKIAGLDMDGVRDLLAHLGTVQDARREMTEDIDMNLNFSCKMMPKAGGLPLQEDDALAYLDRVMQSQSIAENRPRLRPRPAPPAPPTAPAESWQRVELCPGVELHFRTALDPFLQRRIQQLIDFARHIFPSSIS